MVHVGYAFIKTYPVCINIPGYYRMIYKNTLRARRNITHMRSNTSMYHLISPVRFFCKVVVVTWVLALQACCLTFELFGIIPKISKVRQVEFLQT